MQSQDNEFTHALTDLFYSRERWGKHSGTRSYSVVKISGNKLTKWSFTAHSDSWLCSGYLLYVFTLGKHIVYYSHSIHITLIYICMYTFLPPSRKNVQALPVVLQRSRVRSPDYTVATSFFILIINKLL